MSKRRRIGFDVLSTKICFCSWLVAVGVLTAQQASADMLMLIEGKPGESIVSWTLSGSSVAFADGNNNFLNAAWNLEDGYDPFPPEVNPMFGNFDIVSGGGQFMNETTQTTRDIDSIFFQDSTLFDTVDRFGVGTGTETYTINNGDIFSWSGSGTIDLDERGLTFDDLVPGSGLGSFRVGNGPVLLRARLTIASTIIPEPGIPVALLSATLVAGMRRRR